MLGFYATASRAVSEGPVTSLSTITITASISESADTASATSLLTATVTASISESPDTVASTVATTALASGGQGTCTIDFGSFPGSNEASVTVTGITSILSTSKAEAFVMGDSSTTDHSASDHKYFTAFTGLTCGTPTTATGFIVYARSIEKLQGTFLLNYVWAN